MVTQENVLKIANLARLEISQDQLEKFTNQMNETLKFIESLNRLDTSKIIPTSHATPTANAFREDQIILSEIRDLVLEGSPEHEDHFFRVPKVI